MEYNNLIGLTSKSAKDILSRVGSNTLPKFSHVSLTTIFIRQFKSPFIYILLIAAIISFTLGQLVNSFFIVLVLLLNAVIGTIQEYAADKAASSLIKLVPQQTTVLRDGRQFKIDASDIVPEDIVLLFSGDKVPADIKLISTKELLVDESMLTGESIPSLKKSFVKYKNFASVIERLDWCFAGTIVVRGRGIGIVIKTGAETQIGSIAKSVQDSRLSKPPLMQRIEKFTLRISYSMLVVISVIFLITYLRGDNIYDVFLLGVALAVSAIPEGLPVAITVALAIGMKRMAQSGVIVRKLIAIESLGSCTYIASDKTGTLTVNKMTIRKVILANNSEYKVTGEGLDIRGEIVERLEIDKDNLNLLLTTGILTSEAQLLHINDKWQADGDTVDLAFLVLAEKAGIDNQSFKNHHPPLATIPYESESAFSASMNYFNDVLHLFVKGSVDKILCLSEGSEIQQDFSYIKDQENQLAKEGYRVLAVAHRTLNKLPQNIKSELHSLEFIGLVGIIDPCRKEAIKAIKQCREANIKVAMITGDHKVTAAVLSQELGIARQQMGREKDIPVTGSQLIQAKAKGQGYFDKLVQKARIFARVEPQQKSDIVDSLIDQGEFVAMTGDGVNDAPALKHAHVGISMGLRGTDVARENSDIILTDDNFSSIVKGIKEGRVVYNNIRKVIFLLISTGASEVLLILLSLLFGLPLPLMPIQLLWLNLVTNGIQDVALVFEPEEGDELKKPPRDPNEPIFNRIMIERIFINSLVMSSIAFAIFYLQIKGGAGVLEARNVTLLLMVLFENVHVFNCRSETLSIFKQPILGNPLLLFGMLMAQGIHITAMHIPILQKVLMISPVNINQWRNLLVIALTLILVDEIHKAWHRRKLNSYLNK